MCTAATHAHTYAELPNVYLVYMWHIAGYMNKNAKISARLQLFTARSRGWIGRDRIADIVQHRAACTIQVSLCMHVHSHRNMSAGHPTATSTLILRVANRLSADVRFLQ
jgi:hypothetical protein